MKTLTLNSGILIRRDGLNLTLLNIPGVLTPEQTQELAAALQGELDPEYIYHCGAVAHPLPYARFKAKNERLQKLLDHPLSEKGEDPNAKEINKLSCELGF